MKLLVNALYRIIVLEIVMEMLYLKKIYINESDKFFCLKNMKGIFRLMTDTDEHYTRRLLPLGSTELIANRSGFCKPSIIRGR